MERWKAEFSQLLRRPQALLLDSRYFPVMGVLLLLVDAVATAGIIWKVPCELIIVLDSCTIESSVFCVLCRHRN